MFFSDSNAAFRGETVHLKSFPSSKAAQLNHHVKPTLQQYTYDAATIHLDINYILRCKNNEELKELPKNKMKLAHAYQEYNIGKICISSIVTCTDEGLKCMCISSNFEFIEHNQTTAKDSRKDGVHLTESGKICLARNLLDRINVFLCNRRSRNSELVNLV